MSESLARPIGRFLVLFLAITLTLPNPAFALRLRLEEPSPHASALRQTGLEEQERDGQAVGPKRELLAALTTTSIPTPVGNWQGAPIRPAAGLEGRSVDIDQFPQLLAGVLQQHTQGQNLVEVVLFFETSGRRSDPLTLPMREAIPAQWPSQIAQTLRRAGITREVAPQWVVEKVDEVSAVFGATEDAVRKAPFNRRIIEVHLEPQLSDSAAARARAVSPAFEEAFVHSSLGHIEKQHPDYPEIRQAAEGVLRGRISYEQAVRKLVDENGPDWEPSVRRILAFALKAAEHKIDFARHAFWVFIGGDLSVPPSDPSDHLVIVGSLKEMDAVQRTEEQVFQILRETKELIEGRQGASMEEGEEQKGERKEIKTVTLKNGAVEAELLVRVMMLSLQSLMEKEPIVFYELVMKARDPGHKFFGTTEDTLKGLSLVQPDGRLHESIRNVVVSAVEGDGLDMRLTSPLKAGMEEGDVKVARERLLEFVESPDVQSVLRTFASVRSTPDEVIDLTQYFSERMNQETLRQAGFTLGKAQMIPPAVYGSAQPLSRSLTVYVEEGIEWTEQVKEQLRQDPSGRIRLVEVGESTRADVVIASRDIRFLPDRQILIHVESLKAAAVVKPGLFVHLERQGLLAIPGGVIFLHSGDFREDVQLFA